MKLRIQNYGLACLISGAAALTLVLGCVGGHPHKKSTDRFIDDKVIAERVQAVLAGNATYHFPQVQVAATNGVVMLSGSVQMAQQKEQATALAQSVDDVKKVENRVQVAGAAKE